MGAKGVIASSQAGKGRGAGGNLDIGVATGNADSTELRARIDALVSAPRVLGASGEPASPLGAAWLESPLGPMLAVADEGSLLLLEFVERRGLEAAVERLARAAPLAAGRPGPIESIEGELREYFAGQRREFETPISLKGSEFQRGVWGRLQRIPAGATISYLQLAHAVGSPNGFRAVAQANGANQLAVIVPCHRVINTSGELGGYGAGVERKRWLLEHERKYFGAAAGRLF